MDEGYLVHKLSRPHAHRPFKPLPKIRATLRADPMVVIRCRVATRQAIGDAIGKLCLAECTVIMIPVRLIRRPAPEKERHPMEMGLLTHGPSVVFIDHTGSY